MLSRSDSVLVVIDVQEKLARVMRDLDFTVKNIGMLVKSALEFSIPTIYTEQYPKGLGETIEPLKGLLAEAKRFDKMSFSLVKIPEIVEYIESLGRKTIVLCGIEAHICVFSSAVDLKEMGYNVVVAIDAVTSREERFYESIRAFYNSGSIVSLPAESVVFYWLEFAGTPEFKRIQKIILGKD